ncbi:MAG: hypothetical protein JO294_12400 [Alphaproteobacteria bacterium]|nr:hypothetical protein [Alphaproteobacteria bacterium]
MKRTYAALALSTAVAAAATLIAAPASSAVTVAKTYVACNEYGACWRVKRLYAYGPKTPIRYYQSGWYETHRADAKVRWLSDPVDAPGYYDRAGIWHADPAARAVSGGVSGAALGAAIGCLVTLPIGCAPGAATGAAIGGGTGAAVGVATTPH